MAIKGTAKIKFVGDKVVLVDANSPQTNNMDMATKGGSFYPYYDEKGSLQHKQAVCDIEVAPALQTAIEFANISGIAAAINEHGEKAAFRLIAPNGDEMGVLTIKDVFEDFVK